MAPTILQILVYAYLNRLPASRACKRPSCSALLLVPILDQTQQVRDQISLRATHHLGMPAHNRSEGTHDYRRVPDGTIGAVTDLQDEGRWMNVEM